MNKEDLYKLLENIDLNDKITKIDICQLNSGVIYSAIIDSEKQIVNFIKLEPGSLNEKLIEKYILDIFKEDDKHE